MEMQLVAVVGGLVLVVLLVAVLVVARCYRRLDSGTALVIRGAWGSRVSFDDVLVLPLVQRAETIDLTLKAVAVECRGKDGLTCHDSIRADVVATVHVRVNRTFDDVLKVADTVGCARAGDSQQLRDLFVPRFIEALRTVAQHLEFETLHARRGDFKDQMIEVVGRDLNGYILEDFVVVEIEQTPLAMLDPNNILDAIGIRKITDRTSEENIRTNELKQRERVEILKQNRIADEQALRIEQERAEAEARAGQGIHAGFMGKR